MLAQQRHQYILEQLDCYQSVSVAELVTQLNSSTATVRRDLALLEQQKQLKRVHGGAITIESSLNIEKSFNEKINEQLEAKKKVAQYATRHFLKHQKILFLDAGSAVHALIPHLKNKDVHVVTNGIHHVEALIALHIPTTLLGGNVRENTQAIVGSLTIEQVKNMQFDLSFLGTNGIDMIFGCSTTNQDEAILKSTVIKQSNQVVVLADVKKFERLLPYRFTSVDNVNIVTNSCPKHYTKLKTLHRSAK